MIKQHKRKIAKYAATWRGLAPEIKFFSFSVVMLLVSQLWLSHRHSQKALDSIEGDIIGQKASHESTLSRSLSSFQQLSQEYTLNRIRLNLTSADLLAQDQVQRKILEYYSSPPAWVKDYAQWHHQKMAQLTPENWKKQHYLIARCLTSDRQRCGDAAHRLMSVPSGLLMAKQSNRIFLMKWTQPSDLENYLVPPTDQEHYIDWRIPDWLQTEMGNLEQYDSDILTISHVRSLSRANDMSKTVIILRHMMRDHGSHFYNRFVTPGEPNYRIAFGIIWKMMFRPSPQVASLLQANMEALGIQSNSYVTAQLRTLREETVEKVQGLAKSSLDCLASLQPSAQHKVVVASESQQVLDAAMDLQGFSKQILGLKTSVSILSLDKDTEEWRNRTKEDYYPAFVYLYILSHSKCVSYFDDKDGKWGSLISHNPLCSAVMKYRPPASVVCDKLDVWVVAPDLKPDAGELDPAVVSNAVVLSDQGNANKTAIAAAVAAASVEEDKTVYWEPLPEFPDWMNDYFAWHREARAKLTEDNWQSYRYLVLRCLGTDERCGGASDRLQSFLLGILFASLGERILLIHWERPAALEEFLVPPQVGLDWRMPAWLDEKLDYNKARMIITTAFKPVTSNSLLVTMRHQQFWVRLTSALRQ